MTARFEVYKDKAGKFRWRLLAADGQNIASGDAYETKAAAIKGTERVAAVAREAVGAVVGNAAAVGDAIGKTTQPRPAPTAARRKPRPDKPVLDEAYWGQEPSPEEVRDAVNMDLERQFAARDRLIDRSITRAQAAKLLGVAEQTISTLIRSGDLLAIKEGREHRIPAWQFNPATERGILPGIRQLNDVYPGGLASLSEWVLLPNSEFDGATPAELLTKGNIEPVVEIARIGTAAAW